MKNSNLAERVETLERELAEMKRRVGGTDSSTPKKEWRDYVGMFKDDKYFESAMKAGAAYRRSLRPKAVAKKAKRK